MTLKDAHYEAMKLLEPTWTDEEIAADFEKFATDLGIFHADMEREFVTEEDKKWVMAQDIPF